MKPAPFHYHVPKTVEEAVALLAEFGPEEGRVLAGGQSLVPSMAFRLACPPHLVDINGIESLRAVSVDGGVVRIGAGVRHAAFDGHSNGVPGPTGRLLRTVVRHIAHYPIRTRGTFCGSLANADPASEWCCVFAALDGTAVAKSARGERRIPAGDYFAGVMTTALAPDELLTAIELPLLAEGTRAGFLEFSRRPGDFAIAMVLVTFAVADGRIVEPRVAVGGAEAHPRRIAAAEDTLRGHAPEPALFEAAAAAAAEAIDPMEDHSNTADYRRALVRTLTRRALENVA